MRHPAAAKIQDQLSFVPQHHRSRFGGYIKKNVSAGFIWTT